MSKGLLDRFYGCMTGALALPVFTERRENNMRPRDMRFRMIGADAVRDPTRAALHLTPSGDAELRGTVYQGTHTHTHRQTKLLMQVATCL